MLEKGKADFHLRRVLGDSHIDVRLRHEPRLPATHPEGFLEPDLVLELTHGSLKQTWVLDSKFKNYDLPAPSYQRESAEKFGSHFHADLLGVAEEKYRRRLQVTGTVIVHPHHEPQYVFLDQSKTDSWRRDKISAERGHSVLAIPLRPGRETGNHIILLLRVILGYRMKIDNICWICGNEAEKHGVPGSLGDGYTCVGCRSFWISHWCFNQNCSQKPLLKFSRLAIHKTEEGQPDRKSTRLNSSHVSESRMPSSA